MTTTITEQSYQDTEEQEQQEKVLVYVTSEQYAEAKREKLNLSTQLAAMEAQNTQNQINIWNYGVSNKSGNTIWTPWGSLRKDGDCVDYGPWRFVCRAISEKDKAAWKADYLKTYANSYMYSRHPPTTFEFDENRGLCILLTRNDNDPIWIDAHTGTTVELPITHFNTWNYLNRVDVAGNKDYMHYLINKAKFVPAISYDAEFKAFHKVNYKNAHIVSCYNTMEHEILRDHEGWYDHDKNLKSTYFSDLSKEINKAIDAFKKKRSALQSKISKQNTLIKCFESNIAINEFQETRKNARAEKVLENKGKKLGKEFEQFARLALELANIKETIAELEKEIVSDDCQLEHSYFNNRMEKVMVGFNALRGFIKPKPNKQQ